VGYRFGPSFDSYFWDFSRHIPTRPCLICVYLQFDKASPRSFANLFESKHTYFGPCLVFA
jgi:hypothetical protein